MRTVLICSATSSPLVCHHVRAAVMRAHCLVAVGWQIAIYRYDPVASVVLDTCARYEIPFIVTRTRRESLRIADKVVAFGCAAIAARAKRPGWLNGRSLDVQLPLW